MSFPATRARPPVPLPLTTIHIPSRIACSFSGVMSNFDCGGGPGTAFQPSPLPSSIALTRCGVTRVPPLAIVAMYTAIDTGVTETAPCPMPTEIVSPAHHFLAPDFLLPLRRRHQASNLVGQIDTALHAKPEQRGPLVDAIDAEHVGDSVVQTSHDCAIAVFRSTDPWPPFFQHLK